MLLSIKKLHTTKTTVIEANEKLTKSLLCHVQFYYLKTFSSSNFNGRHIIAKRVLIAKLLHSIYINMKIMV
jgi:hypothetical protein